MQSVNGIIIGVSMKMNKNDSVRFSMSTLIQEFGYSGLPKENLIVIITREAITLLLL